MVFELSIFKNFKKTGRKSKIETRPGFYLVNEMPMYKTY